MNKNKTQTELNPTFFRAPHENTKINKDEIQYRQMTIKDISQIVKLLNDTLGKTYTSISEMLSLFYKVLKGNAEVIVAVYSYNVVGVIINVLESPIFVSETVNIPIPKNVEKVFCLQTLAVSNNYQKLGIGNKLVALTMSSDFYKDNMSLAYSVGWRPRGVTHIYKILSNYDWVSLKIVDSFWFEDSINNGYHCSNCGNPCYCAAEIFFKNS